MDGHSSLQTVEHVVFSFGGYAAKNQIKPWIKNEVCSWSFFHIRFA